MNTNNNSLETERGAVETALTVKLGIDLHAVDAVVCRQDGGQVPKPGRRMKAAEVVALAQELIASGARVISCYEAGPCGYGLHRRLTAVGVHNVVVVPRRWDPQGQRVKTDRRDARELCDALDRYSRGNLEAFSVVRVPSEAQERWRAIGRQRGALVKERQRCVVRGHGLMLQAGVQAEADWWRPRVWPALATELPLELRTRVQVWAEQAQRLETEVVRWSAQVERYGEEQVVPKGLGVLTAGLVQMEVLDWTRFSNRRAVGSYTGLCPSEYSSGGQRRQGGVNKHGNPRLRHQLVEAVWRLLQWQPAYPPLAAVRAAASRRQRKRAVVAAARKLAIDLWRLNTGQCPAEKLGLTLR